MLTGESTPLVRERGDRVYAGTLNYDGAVVCRAQSLGEDTVLAQIARMVAQAQSSRAPMEQLADRASSIFVPTVIALRRCHIRDLGPRHALSRNGSRQFGRGACDRLPLRDGACDSRCSHRCGRTGSPARRPVTKAANRLNGFRTLTQLCWTRPGP